MSNHFLEDWILFYSSWKRLKAADVFVLDFCEIKMLKRDKKGIKRSSEFFLKVLMGVSPFTDVYGSLRAFECLWCFASFPRTLEKGPRQGQLIWQEIGTVWASLGEAWWIGETIVWWCLRFVGQMDWDGLGRFGCVWNLFLFGTHLLCGVIILGCFSLSFRSDSFSVMFIHFLDISHESISDCRATGPAMEGALAEQQEHSGLREYGWSYSGLL